jgi:hypothetical protein
MQKFFLGLMMILTAGCGGTLNQEQRDFMREGMKSTKVTRVSPSQLTQAAWEKGKAIQQAIGSDTWLAKQDQIAALQQETGTRIYLLKDAGVLTGKKKEILEAYQSAADPADLRENVQKIGQDSMFYTFPVTFERPDGSKVFSHAIAVDMSIKLIIRSLPK